MFPLALLAAFVGDADAAAYYFTDAGLRGMARGGAFVAGVDDLSAQYYNPAGLVRLGRGQVYVNMSFVDQDVNFKRVDYTEEGEVRREFEPVENGAPMMTIPQFAVGHNFGLEDTYFAFGFHPPFAPQLQYPAGGAQRYSLVDSLVWQWYMGPSVAHRVLPWLTIGAGVYWSPIRAEQSLDIMLCQDEKPDGETTQCRTDFSDEDDPVAAEEEYARQSDVGVAMKMWDRNNITWNAGVLIEPADWIAIGASVTPPINVEGKGSLAVSFGDEHWLVDDPLKVINKQSFSDDDVTVLLTLPWIVRGGVAVKPVETVELEFATVWQRWSMTDEIRVTDVKIVIEDNPETSALQEDIPITDDVVLPADYVNAFSYRLGGDFDATDWLTLRAGGFYEQSAVPTATQSVALVDGDKWGYGFGATFFLKDVLSFEGALSQTFIADRNIRNSRVARKEIPVDLISALSGEPLEANLVDGATVGNGTFGSKLTFLSVGATYYFGKKAGG